MSTAAAAREAWTGPIIHAEDLWRTYQMGAEEIQALRGVTFEICEITLKNRNLKREQFIQEAEFTPSGVVRIAKRQLAGQAYIKP